jgi:hypothetical protein
MTVGFDNDTFLSRNGVTAGNDQNGSAIKFRSQDSDYRVYIPDKDPDKSTISYNSAGQMVLTLSVDHIIGTELSKDDHSTATMTFDTDGSLVQTDMTVTFEDSGPLTIPRWLVTDVDVTVAVLGLVLAPDSDGGSVAEALKVIKDIDDFVRTFNNITSNIRKFTDDGGRLNFPAVVAMEMNRACCSVTA